jgi:hypothetical protein
MEADALQAPNGEESQGLVRLSVLICVGLAREGARGADPGAYLGAKIGRFAGVFESRMRFSVSQALLACSETPMVLAASRALQWWK